MLQDDEPALATDESNESDAQMVAWFSDEEEENGDQW